MWGTLIPWIIAIVFVFLAVMLILIFKGKGSSALDYFKNLLRFGR